ncbi:hypothetical protein ATC1_13273 [Flexilinea flocculi]|uniref:Uncharacterized protein n=1 Tax=Flexilinea flocculi TaxID=1678840 RepID=A0A0S7BIZ1_9CHLR|nr:hypothetical protein ATC1_13273 [Flexilinea flocculi]
MTPANVIFGGVYKKKIVYSLLVNFIDGINTKCDQRDTFERNIQTKGL